MMTCAGDDRRRDGPMLVASARSRSGRPIRRRRHAARLRHQNAASDDDPASCWNSPASAAPCWGTPVHRRRKRRLHTMALAIG
jgi:hypothetical protein